MKSIILADEEKILLEFLQKYKCLRLSQVFKIFGNIPQDRVLKTLNIMEKDFLLEVDDADYVKIDRNINPSHYTDSMNAFWVFLTFINDVDIRANYPAAYPSEIFFLKNGEQYEALYVKKGNEFVINMLLADAKDEAVKEIEKLSELDIDLRMKYVIGVDSKETIEKIISYPSVNEENLKRILFVIMEFEDNTQEPTRKFVSF